MPYYDKYGVRLASAIAWARLFEHDPEGYGRVDYTELGPVKVSTVWLGIDHNAQGNSELAIFESMVFDEHGQELDQRRYPTLEAAQEGHDAFCEEYAQEGIDTAG